MRRRTAHSALAIAGISLLAAAPPVSAKKSDKDEELGKLRVATAAAVAPTTGVATAVAECPPKTKVVGGGFAFQAPSSTEDFLNPLESRREGRRAWTVSAYRVDTAGVGPSMAISAEAYCRSGLGKVSERTESTVIFGAANTAAPVATCGLGKPALGGGFSIAPPADPNDFHSALYENLMAGRVGWVMRSINLTPPPQTGVFTSHVYCLKKDEKGPKTVSGAGTIPATQFAVGVADTEPCPGKRDAFAGGFQVPPFIGAPVLPLITESRSVGERWHVAVSHLSGGTGASNVAAYGYCS